MLNQLYEGDAFKLDTESNLTVLIVDPGHKGRHAMKEALQALSSVKAVGSRTTHHFVIDTLSENSIDVVVFDEATGVDNIIDGVREVRSHPNGEDIGFVVAAKEFGPETIRRFSQVGILGFLQKPYDETSLHNALGQSLGETSLATKVVLASMRDARFFSSFTNRELLRLLNICETRNFEPEEVIFKEGEPGDTMYIVLSGQISIRKQFPDGVKELTVINPGESFGEMAILDNDPRSADAVAAWDATVFEIDNATLQEDDSVLALKLSRQIAVMLARKIRAFNYR